MPVMTVAQAEGGSLDVLGGRQVPLPATVQRAWVLSYRFRFDGDSELDYLSKHPTVLLFSSRERALADVETLGIRPRRRYSPRNPDWQEGYVTDTQPNGQVVKWHIQLMLQTVDEDDAED